MSEVKLTKKQLKSKNFKKSKEEKENEKESLKRAREEPVATTTTTTTTAADGTTITTTEEQPVKKKRKTRRGKKGRGSAAAKSNRFIIFVGNLPFNITKMELTSFFKNCVPDEIRIRPDKGIAFLEFDPDTCAKGSSIQKRMDNALLQNKTMFHDRKINVELTAGGGGNSENRLGKIKTKNDKMEIERVERIDKMIKNNRAVPKKDATEEEEPKKSEKSVSSSAIHPDRLRLLK